MASSAYSIVLGSAPALQKHHPSFLLNLSAYELAKIVVSTPKLHKIGYQGNGTSFDFHSSGKHCDRVFEVQYCLQS
jgi:hypothetical protein